MSILIMFFKCIFEHKLWLIDIMYVLLGNTILLGKGYTTKQLHMSMTTYLIKMYHIKTY
jgi:hypothetical protein